METFILVMHLGTGFKSHRVELPTEVACTAQARRWMHEARAWRVRSALPAVDGPVWACYPARIERKVILAAYP